MVAYLLYMATTYTLAQIEAELSDLADFEEENSVTRAKSFVTWARRWLIQYPRRQEDELSVLEMDTNAVRALLAQALAFVSASPSSDGSGSSVRYSSFENFRD